jgi:capsular exopolysaccharide synthesis family protein
MNGFLREDEKENSEKVENSLTYIRRYIDTLNAQLRISQVEKTNYSVQNNVYAPTEQLTAALEEIRQSKLKIDEANDKIYALENLQKSIQNNSNIQFNLEGNVLSDNELEKMIREKNKLIHDYNASHPFIKELNKNIAERTQSSMQKSKNSIHNEMILYQRKLAEIRSAQSEAKNDLRNLPEKDMEYNKIQKEVEIKEKYVLELLDKQIQYLIFKSSISSDYLVIQQPKTKPEVVSPNKTILYSSGILSFLLLCFLIFFYRYLSFDKIVSLAELKRKTNVPILGYIPFVSEALLEQVSKNAPESRLVVLKNSKSRNAEVFKKMRASLKYTSKGEYKVIASTSTISGEGKTFVLINLAAVHALLDKKVIIIDLDLRKPRISKSFKLDNTLGMSNLLSSSDANLDDHIKKGVILDNLDVITSGPVPPNPSELITSDRFDEILTELKTKYDYIFIDTPPVGLVNESIEIINKADIPLYLVRFNYSRKDFLNTLNETANLKKGNPIYIVINHFGDGASSYVNYDYGGYSSYYGYGANYGYHKKHEGYYTEDSKMKTPSIFELIINFFDWKL